MNIILTGTKHSGKSTAAAKILSSYAGKAVGFRTVFENRCEENQTLYVEDINSGVKMKAACWDDSGRSLYPEAFDGFAASLIGKGSELVFIDELGFLEKNCGELEKKVVSAFDSGRNVLAVVRIDAAGWMQDLKKRHDTTVIALTDSNRDSIPGQVLKLLKNSLE